MKAFNLAEFGLDKLTQVDMDQPQPGSGQVLVKLQAASLNFRDVLIAQGFYNPNLELPIVPLSDGAGEVVSVGDGVSRVSVGDLVTPLFFPNWVSGPGDWALRGASVGCEVPGVLREYGVFDEGAVSKIPAGMSAAEAATLPCAALTAWTCMFTASGVTAGQKVLAMGTGGVSIFALQFAKASGCEAVVTSSSDDKLAKAKDLGADHLINYKSREDWGQAAVEATGGGVNCVVEIGGAGTLAQSLGALSVGGHVPIIGNLAGVKTELEILPIVGKNANIHGVTVGHRDDYEAMLAFIAKHNIKPVIGKTYAFDEAGQALQDLVKGEHFGKVVINIQ